MWLCATVGVSRQSELVHVHEKDNVGRAGWDVGFVGVRGVGQEFGGELEAGNHVGIREGCAGVVKVRSE